MSDEIKISRPRVRVVLEAGDGQLVQVDVQTDNRDAVRFDVMRSRKNWPGGDTAPMLWMTVQAWSALKRSNDAQLAATFADQLKDVDKFFDACVDVVPIDADGNVIKQGGDLVGMTAAPTNAATESD